MVNISSSRVTSEVIKSTSNPSVAEASLWTTFAAGSIVPVDVSTQEVAVQSVPYVALLYARGAVKS